MRDSYNSQHIPSRRQHLPPHAVAKMMDTTMTDNKDKGKATDALGAMVAAVPIVRAADLGTETQDNQKQS